MRAIPTIRPRSAILAALVVGLMLPFGPSPTIADAVTPRAQPTLPPSGPTPPTSVDADDILIRYAPGTSAARRAEIERSHGLVRVRGDRAGRSDVVRADGRSIATVRRHLTDVPEVIAVAPNHRRTLAIDPEDEPYYDALWALDNRGQEVFDSTGIADIDIDGREAHAHALGSPSIVVAVIDDGIDFDHPDLAAQAWTNPGEAGSKATNGIDDDGNGYIDDVHGWDFCNDDNSVYEPGPEDPDGHGTHVAGTIAASLDGEGVVGVAPGVRLMALKFIKVEDDPASRECGWDDMAIEAIDYAASFGVPIINASWGGPGDSAVLDSAIRHSGALFVAAAGNNAQDIDLAGGPRFYPASFSANNIISVTAITQTGSLAPFANRGTKSVDLAAPGTNILSTWPAASGYAWSSGTSMAAPHVAGVAALVASRSAALRDDPVALRARLLKGAAPVSGASGTTQSGRMVNAFRAIDLQSPSTAPLLRFAIPIGSGVTPTTFVVSATGPIATDLITGVVSHQVQRVGSTGSAVAVPLTNPIPTARTTLTLGQTYTFRVRATDLAGNTSAWKASTPIVAQALSEGSSAARYTGSWSNVSTTAALGGRLRRTTTDNASVTFTATGRSLAIVGNRGPSSGRVRVYVDGVLRSTVDLYRSSAQSRVVVFSTNWEHEGVHAIRLVADVSAARPRVEVDGAVVVRAAIPVRVQLPRYSVNE